MTTISATHLELIDIAGNPTTDELHRFTHDPRQGRVKRGFVGGCVGYVYPTPRRARSVGGSAGWVHPW
jgi:hypothetical protein